MKRLLPITCGALLWLTACADFNPTPATAHSSVVAPPGEPVMPEVRQFPAEGAEDPDNPLIRTETLEIEGEKPMTIFVFKNIETLEKKSSTEAPNHPADLRNVP